MIQLQVWLRPPIGPPRPAGELIVAEPDQRRGGRLHGEFRYLREYPDWSGAFAVGTLHLRSDPGGGRNHVVSLQTLLAADGYYAADYTDLADVLRQISNRPERDLPLLYHQMVFNAVLGNTDDHLKNFAMVHGAEGWRLSPAYDLLPDVNERREHVLHFGSAGLVPTAAAMNAQSGSFGIAPGTARAIQQQVLDAFSAWPERFCAANVPNTDIKRLSGSIEQRLDRLRS